jgi:AraC-like DNA-binding protein
MRHRGGEIIDRHLHDEGFVALVLAGHYVEAGDSGRHRVAAGDVIVHRPFEQHLDRIAAGGAEVLVLPLGDSWPRTVLARVEDADAIARLAERDVAAASRALAEAMIETPAAIADWPDLLARDLLADPGLRLSQWAERHGLHPGTLARGFGQIFDISPAGYRHAARTRRAIEQIVLGTAPLSAVAAEQGFADQAHMSRAVKRVTGLPPSRLRRAFPFARAA